MATADDSGFPSFFADAGSADALHRRLKDQPLDTARPAAEAAAVDAFAFLSSLPAALLASQRRELERITASGGREDPRLDAVQASIDQLHRFAATGSQGMARARRWSVALAAPQDAFHGFVSDRSFAPRQGLTVRVGGAHAPANEILSATTAEDGYFRIPLGAETGAAAGAGTATARRDALDVQILDASGRVVHRDPFPLPLDQGAVYREYLVAVE